VLRSIGKGLVGVLPLLCGSAMAQQAPSSEANSVAPVEYCSVALSLREPKASCGLAPVVASGIPVVVSLPLKTVDNPANIGFSIAVSVQSPGSETVRIGSVGLYPADQPGKFVLRVNTALKKLQRTGDALSQAQLVLELKVAPQSKADRLAVEIGPLQWSYEEPR
jgi:hypothetical protein